MQFINEEKNKAFTQQVQAAILTTNVDNSSSQGNRGFKTNGCNNTRDQIFLLSYAEANKYFGVKWDPSVLASNYKSRISPTAYAIAQGADIHQTQYKVDGSTATWWWLRSPGREEKFAANVGSDGMLGSSYVSYSAGIRPTLWIDLGADILYS